MAIVSRRSLLLLLASLLLIETSLLKAVASDEVEEVQKSQSSLIVSKADKETSLNLPQRLNVQPQQDRNLGLGVCPSLLGRVVCPPATPRKIIRHDCVRNIRGTFDLIVDAAKRLMKFNIQIIQNNIDALNDQINDLRTQIKVKRIQKDVLHDQLEALMGDPNAQNERQALRVQIRALHLIIKGMFADIRALMPGFGPLNQDIRDERELFEIRRRNACRDFQIAVAANCVDCASLGISPPPPPMITLNICIDRLFNSSAIEISPDVDLSSSGPSCAEIGGICMYECNSTEYDCQPDASCLKLVKESDDDLILVNNTLCSCGLPKA